MKSAPSVATAAPKRVEPAPDQERVELFTLKAFCRTHGLGRTRAYEEIAAGRLRAVKAGGRVLVPAVEAERWRENLPALKLIRYEPAEPAAKTTKAGA